MPTIRYGSVVFPTLLAVIFTSDDDGGPIEGVPVFAHATGEVVFPKEKMPFDIPLGTLASDHAGYLSFDLELLERRLADIKIQGDLSREKEVDVVVEHIWLHPYSIIAQSIDALNVENVADQAIVVRLMVPPDSVFKFQGVGFCSIQKASLSDWYLSPGSFSHMPAVLIGEDGCETLLPSNVATQEYRVKQVLPLRSHVYISYPEIAPQKAPKRSAETEPTLQRAGTGSFFAAAGAVSDMIKQQLLTLSTPARAGFTVTYSVEWSPIGHGLGQIAYSMPLAPGEQVNIAVIDWARTSTDKHVESTGLSDSLSHDTTRDRNIGEVVESALKEWQRGHSLMAGTAATGGYGGFVGGALSMGGASTYTAGERDLTADSTQQLLDQFSQASTAIRDLRSTVVVQSSQSETDKLQTRTVRNYNHSHALTLLYYEVLRHYRVVVERARLDPCLLIKQPMPLFDAPSLFTYRSILEPALLLPDMKLGFDASEKLFAYNLTPSPPPPQPPSDLLFTLFRILISLGGVTTTTEFRCRVKGPAPEFATQRLLNVMERNEVLGDPHMFDVQVGATVELQAAPEGSSIRWGDISFFEFTVSPDTTADHSIFVTKIEVRGIDGNGVEHPMGAWFGAPEHRYAGAPTMFPSISAPSPPDPPPVPEPIFRLSDEERVAYVKLLQHLNSNRPYYYRLIWLSEDAGSRYIRLSNLTVELDPGDKRALTDVIENRVVDVLGDSIVVPLGANYLDKILAKNAEDAAAYQSSLGHARTEKLLSLPTRGVFAEAKLGHCNASEIIDNRRFWDWQTSPIPASDSAPAITGISGESRNVTQNLMPTALPSSILSIQQPAPAPDPIGLRSALDVMKTPGIFNDMSGIAQLKDLLNTLTNAAVQAQGMGLSATQAQKGNDGSGSGKGSVPGSTPGGAAPKGTGGTPTPAPSGDKPSQDAGGGPADKRGGPADVAGGPVDAGSAPAGKGDGPTTDSGMPGPSTPAPVDNPPPKKDTPPPKKTTTPAKAVGTSSADLHFICTNGFVPDAVAIYVTPQSKWGYVLANQPIYDSRKGLGNLKGLDAWNTVSIGPDDQNMTVSISGWLDIFGSVEANPKRGLIST